MRAGVFLWLLLQPVVSGQIQAPFPAWTYLTSTVTSDLEFSATTVAGTGGGANQRMAAVVVYMESPSGRSAGASEYSGVTTGQATGYLPLCAEDFCEDGNFSTSTMGTRVWTGYPTARQEYPDPAKAKPMIPWVQWMHSALSADSIAKQDGEVEFIAFLMKLPQCEGTPIISIELTKDPSSIAIDIESTPRKAIDFWQDGNAGAVRWKIRTNALNQQSGTVEVAASLAEIPPGCRVSGNPVTRKLLVVSP